MTLDPKILASLISRLDAAGSRPARGKVVAEFAGLCRVSMAQLRRLAKDAGVGFGYKTRSDAGEVDPVRSAAADVVANLIIKSQGAMPTWKAIELAGDLGMISKALAADLPTHYVDRYIRSNEIERKASEVPAATRKIKWGNPGEVLQVDSTNCAQWFFVDKGGRVCATQNGQVYRNKPAKGTPIMRYVASDPPSDLFRIKYYVCDGESAEVLLNFLYFAFSRDPRPELMPLAGVTKVLVSDNGSGLKSAAVKNLCADLGIEHRRHLPHHAWAKGNVEHDMRLWEQGFESELRQFPARDIDDMNERATASLYRYISTRVHSRHKMTRQMFYSKFLATSQVMPPPWEQFVEAATTTREERTVGGDLIISYEGSEYYVGAVPGVQRDSKVEVAKAVLAWNDQDKPVRVYFGEEIRIEKALVKDERGQITDERVYQKRDDAIVDARAQRQAIRLAAPMPSERPPVELSNLPTVPVPAARLQLAGPMRSATRSRLSAKMELVKRIGRELSEFEVNGLRWGEAVTSQEIEAAAARINGAFSAGQRDGQAASG